MSFLKRLFTPPVFDDEIKTQHAYMLHIILWTLIFVPIPYVIYTVIFNQEDSIRALIQAAFGETVNILLLIFLRRGYVRQASIVQAGAFWLFFTNTAITGNGVQGEAYLIGYPLVIAITGFLLGGTGAFVLTALSLVSGVYMVNLQLQGQIAGNFTSSPLTTWIISLVLFPVGAVLQHLETRRTRNALSRANASEKRYRLISQVSSDYTFSTILEKNGTMYLNWAAGAFEEMTGYTYEEYVASGGWAAHLHPDDVQKDIQNTEILKTNKPIVSEMRTFKKNSELRWVRVYANPVWDEAENRVTGIVGAVQDITEQKLIEEREERRRILLEKVIAIGKQVTENQDLQNTLKGIWHGVHDFLDFDRLAVFLYNTERNSMDSMIGTTIDGKMEDTSGTWFPIAQWTTFKLVLDKPDGVFITHNYDEENNIPVTHEMYGVKDFAAVAAWAGDKPVAVICVDQLITHRHITDLQLEALRLFAGYAGLAIENARLNKALQSELDQRQSFITELENKNAELERFTYTVSHDLKSPLVTIAGFLSFLERDAVNGNIERVKSNVKRISDAAKKMQSLLNDLLELSRIGRLMSPPENISFEDIVHDAIDHVRGRLDEINANVEVQRDFPIVYGDRIRLVEVVQNLLENSVKYSNPNIQLRIEIGMDQPHDKNAPVFHIRDNGIGIEPKFHERIFGLFNKLDAQSEGTGIGLSLVKRIIEVHNGHIWVESEKGKGATFYFSLPTPQIKE